MKKRILAMTLALILALSALSLSAAAAPAKLKVEVNGETIDFTEELGTPFIDENSRTMLPLRACAYALGFEEDQISWDGSTKTAALTDSEGRSVSFTIGQSFAVINMPAGDEDGEAQTLYMLMDTAAVLKNSRTYLPIRYLAAVFDFEVGWDGSAKTVTLKDSEDDIRQVHIYLTRHGRTEYNTEGRVQGWLDSDLTEAGAAVAKYLGNGLKMSGITFDAAYASDLGRQVRTAEIVLAELGQADLEITQLENFREVCFGSWEGVLESERDEYFCNVSGYSSIDEIYAAGGTLFMDLTIASDTTGTAESADRAAERMIEGLQIAADNALEKGQSNILVVSSGGVISILVERFRGYGANISNASVTDIFYFGGVFMMGNVGSTYYYELGTPAEE